MKTGDVFVICPSDKWTSSFNEYCFVYMVARAGTPGCYRAMMLLVPKNIVAAPGPLQDTAVFHSFGARRFMMTEGSISITTIRKRHILEVMDNMHHIHLGNIGGSLRKMRDIKV